jgi:hypothetical protein
VGHRSGFTAGQMLVALPLKQGQFPSRVLSAGQRVLIVATPGADGAGAGSTSGGSLRNRGQGVTSKGTVATVAEVGATSPATQLTVVDVRVFASDGVRVAQVASTGNLALILLPAGR